MPRYKGDKFRWKGVTDCTRKAKMYSQLMFNEGITLDLWLTADEKRVYVTERNWLEHPEPPEPEGGELYCGEVNRHSVKTGDVELAVLRAIDRRDNPWRYAEWHFFFVNPYQKKVTEIPRYLPLTDYRWTPLTKQIMTMTPWDAKIKLYGASAKALKVFQEHPEKTEMLIRIGKLDILVRGHGYYGDIPAESKQTGNSDA